MPEFGRTLSIDTQVPRSNLRRGKRGGRLDRTGLLPSARADQSTILLSRSRQEPNQASPHTQHSTKTIMLHFENGLIGMPHRPRPRAKAASLVSACTSFLKAPLQLARQAQRNLQPHSSQTASTQYQSAQHPSALHQSALPPSALRAATPAMNSTRRDWIIRSDWMSYLFMGAMLACTFLV